MSEALWMEVPARHIAAHYHLLSIRRDSQGFPSEWRGTFPNCHVWGPYVNEWGQERVNYRKILASLWGVGTWSREQLCSSCWQNPDPLPIQEAAFQHIAAVRESRRAILVPFSRCSHPILCILFGCAYLHNLSHKSYKLLSHYGKW